MNGFNLVIIALHVVLIIALTVLSPIPNWLAREKKLSPVAKYFNVIASRFSAGIARRN
jgi:hypothetical protein